MADLTKPIEWVDKAGSALRRAWQSKGISEARSIASEVAHGMHLKSSGFALEAGALGTAGGLAGYAYAGDHGDRARDAVIGTGLGVLGAVGHRGAVSGYRAASPRVRGAIASSRARTARLEDMKASASKYFGVPAGGTARRYEGPVSAGMDFTTLARNHAGWNDVSPVRSLDPIAAPSTTMRMAAAPSNPYTQNLNGGAGLKFRLTDHYSQPLDWMGGWKSSRSARLGRS